MFLVILKANKLLKRFTKNKLYVKWKGYDNSFNNWVYKKDTV